jgi:hypothetical protein
MRPKRPLTIPELKRLLIGDSRERERWVKMLIEKVREEERAKMEEAS